MRCQRSTTLLAEASDHVQDPGREVLCADPGELEDGERGILGRLQHQGVAGRDRHRDLQRAQ